MKYQEFFDYCLAEMVKNGASDMYLTYLNKPILRLTDILVPIETKVLDNEDLEGITKAVLNEEQFSEFSSTLELNMAYSHDTEERFRLNIFRQKGHIGMVIRHIKSTVPTFADLGLPDIYADFIMKKRGLFIIAGSAGSGKTTSIASIIDHRNTNGTGHIVILEDPIEYYHKNKNAIITQREIGIDTYSYGIALKNAFRQRPDVVVIGEVRDRETIDNAILFCETGHLVLTTIHSNNANHAIERIINMYPEAAQKQILYTLASNLNGIVSQRIIPGIKRSKVLAYEIMINRGLIRNYIEEGAVMKIKALMEKGNQQGMITFDQNLYELVKKGAITKEEAMINADNPGNFALKFNNEKFSRLVRGIDENEQDNGNEF